jgi:hypothetical protein
MPIQVVAEHEYVVGQDTAIKGVAPTGNFLAIFEDNGETGYFYALDKSAEKQPIQDAVHIYNVANVVDKERPSILKIGWSSDSLKVVLLINGYPHAVFDFLNKQGYCRTGFPSRANNDKWSKSGHTWSEDVLELFS